MAFQVPEYIRSLVPYVPGKPIEETQREYKIKKVIKLASNENPLGPSPKAKKAIQSHLKNLHRYPDSSGYHLKNLLSKHLDVSSSKVILGNGSNELIDQLIRTFCVVGDSIVTQKAAFVAYKICAQIHGVQTLEASISENLEVNLDEILNLVRKNERAKIVFLGNPNNPTGKYISAQQLREFTSELSQIRNGSVILALDYAYWEYVTASDLIDGIQLLKEFPQIIVFRTFSKVYGLAGLRIGYAVATDEVISDLEKVRQPFNINSLALIGAQAALSDQNFVKRSQEVNLKGMRFWEKSLTKMEIPFWKSQGNFILADVQKGLKKSGIEVQQFCLKQGVIFRPVANYGLPHALRISIGTPEDNKRAVKVLNLLQMSERKLK